MEKILTSFLLFFLFCGAYAQNGGSIADLEKQAKAKEAELKKIKEEERAISKQISALKEQTQKREAQINKIESDINDIERSIITAENRREALTRSGPMWTCNSEDDIKRLFFGGLMDAGFYGSAYLEEEILFERNLSQKLDLLAAVEKEQTDAKTQISGYEEKNKALHQQSTKIEQEKSVLTKDFEKKQGDLAEAQKKYAAAQKERDELIKSAEQMKKLLQEAEAKRKKEAAKVQTAGTAPKTASVAVIDAQQHSLPWPVNGSVISSFGKEYRNDLKTWIFRDGIKISAAKGEAVMSVSEGLVIYAGEFRSYGNVVIVDHGKGFFTIYGFLSRIDVSNGDTVGARTPLGIAGVDTQQGSMGTGKTALYFEVRRGTAAEDPMKWLQ